MFENIRTASEIEHERLAKKAALRALVGETEEEMFFKLGGILHEARMKECYGNSQISSRRVWPATIKDFRTQRQSGQPHIDVAIAQVRALIENGIAAPNSGRSLAPAPPSGNPAIELARRISGDLGTAAQRPTLISSAEINKRFDEHFKPSE